MRQDAPYENSPEELREALKTSKVEDAKTLIGVTLFLARSQA